MLFFSRDQISPLALNYLDWRISFVCSKIYDVLVLLVGEKDMVWCRYLRWTLNSLCLMSNRKCIIFNLQKRAVTKLVNKTFFTLTTRVKKYFRNLSYINFYSKKVTERTSIDVVMESWCREWTSGHYFVIENKKIPSVQYPRLSGLFLNQLTLPWSTKEFFIAYKSDHIS